MKKKKNSSRKLTENPTFTPINRTQQRILELFAQEQRDLHLALIEKKIPLSHGCLHASLKKLVALEFLQESGGSPNFYSLLSKSQSLLIQGVGKPDIRTHGIELTIPIIQKPLGWNSDYSNKFIKISDEIHMKNWKEEVRARWRGNFMRISDSSISIFFNEFWDPRVEINMLKVMFKGLEFCKDMERIHPGLKLGQIRKGSVIRLSAQEHAIKLPKNAKIEPIQGRTFVIDWSKLYPELEFKDNRKSGDQMQNFSEFIDALADGEISIDDVKYIKEVKGTILELSKREKCRKIYAQAKIHAKFLWLQNHGPGASEVPGDSGQR